MDKFPVGCLIRSWNYYGIVMQNDGHNIYIYWYNWGHLGGDDGATTRESALTLRDVVVVA